MCASIIPMAEASRLGSGAQDTGCIFSSFLPQEVEGMKATADDIICHTAAQTLQLE